MLLKNLNLILSAPRFPENVGMVARACANMGCESLILVNPENWNPEKAVKTATSKGEAILNNLRIAGTLEEALCDSHCSWGATARTGGWRRKLHTPEEAAREIGQACAVGKKVSIVLGNEKSGLSNKEITLCAHLIRIPTFGDLSSLNLAQAALILLYESAKMVKKLHDTENKHKTSLQRGITQGQTFLLERELKQVLRGLNCVQGKNPDYYFLVWHEMLARMNLRRHEFDAWMGLCRQISNLLDKEKI